MQMPGNFKCDKETDRTAQITALFIWHSHAHLTSGDKIGKATEKNVGAAVNWYH